MLTNWEELQKARRKVAKWQRIADKELIGAKYQKAIIKLHKWENREDYWFEQCQKD